MGIDLTLEEDDIRIIMTGLLIYLESMRNSYRAVAENGFGHVKDQTKEELKKARELMKYTEKLYLKLKNLS